MSIPFVGTEDLGNYLRLELDDTDDLGVIAVNAACDTVRSYLGQQVDLVSGDAVNLDGSGTDALLLPELPVVEITSVTTYDADGNDEEPLTVDEDYRIGTGGILWRIPRYNVWPLGHANIAVVYSHGYDTSISSGSGDCYGGVPSDIRLIAVQLAARIYDIGMVQQEAAGSWSATYVGGAGQLNDYEMRALDRWRVRGAA